MGTFNWTATRLKRMRQAVRSYNAAIDRKSKENDRNGISNDYLPSKLTVSEVKDRINNVNDYRRIVGYKNDKKRGRPSQLDRILPSVNKHALDPVETPNATVSKYMKQEIGYARAKQTRVANRNRKAADRRALIEGRKPLEDMTPAEYADRVDGTNLLPPDSGEFDEEAEEEYRQETDEEYRRNREVEDMFNRERREYIGTKYERWLGVWMEPRNLHYTDSMGYDQVISDLEWMYTNRPDVLTEMFESGSDEAQEDFIYLNPTSSVYNALTYDTRHKRAVNFIHEWYLRATGNEKPANQRTPYAYNSDGVSWSTIEEIIKKQAAETKQGWIDLSELFGNKR